MVGINVRENNKKKKKERRLLHCFVVTTSSAVLIVFFLFLEQFNFYQFFCQCVCVLLNRTAKMCNFYHFLSLYRIINNILFPSFYFFFYLFQRHCMSQRILRDWRSNEMCWMYNWSSFQHERCNQLQRLSSRFLFRYNWIGNLYNMWFWAIYQFNKQQQMFWMSQR